MDYTPEQVKDIQVREKKALEYLKSLQLSPAAQVVKVRMTGPDDVFMDKVTPYLADTKYTATPSTNKEVNPTL